MLQYSKSDVEQTQLMTLEEESALQLFYQGKCQELCRKLGLPRKVQATSIAYIKRMYLKYSVMDHSPRLVMLTSLYLAGKTEESYISAERIAEVVGEPSLEKAILKFETQIIQDLDFQLIVFNPYRSLEGFCLFLGDWLQEQSYGSEKSGQLSSKMKTEAYQLADRLLLSDAVFLYPPSQCALAMMKVALEREGLDAVDFIEKTCKHAGGSAADVDAHLTHIQKLSSDAKVPSEDRLRKIDLKLKRCRNPLFDKTSEVYKKMKREEEQQKAERKRKKHMERTQDNNARSSMEQQAGESTEGKRRRSSMD